RIHGRIEMNRANVCIDVLARHPTGRAGEARAAVRTEWRSALLPPGENADGGRHAAVSLEAVQAVPGGDQSRWACQPASAAEAPGARFDLERADPAPRQLARDGNRIAIVIADHAADDTHDHVSQWSESWARP